MVQIRFHRLRVLHQKAPLFGLHFQKVVFKVGFKLLRHGFEKRVGLQGVGGGRGLPCGRLPAAPAVPLAPSRSVRGFGESDFRKERRASADFRKTDGGFQMRQPRLANSHR